ncbi:MAG: radical SAM protein [Thermoplasmata archaeon]|nr:radical SAM protein [Thermoplasmata archaeon]
MKAHDGARAQAAVGMQEIVAGRPSAFGRRRTDLSQITRHPGHSDGILRVVGRAGDPEVALVHVAEIDGRRIEFVESLQTGVPREEKWVVLVSTLFGCPVGCPMCDAGGSYGGRLTARQILAQVDSVVDARYPDRSVPSRKFKVQFARMGEPALNPAVIDALRELPFRYDAPGLMPSVSTVAPSGAGRFFDDLMDVKDDLYRGGRFQLQFSVHTTDALFRDRLVPVPKWDLARMGEYGEEWRRPGDRKVTLNFALADGAPVDIGVMLRHFDPSTFLVKVTPLNPTYSAARSGLRSYVDPDRAEGYPVIEGLRNAGYDVLLSIGEREEDRIGSNCGQYVQAHIRGERSLEGVYTYEVQKGG